MYKRITLYSDMYKSDRSVSHSRITLNRGDNHTLQKRNSSQVAKKKEEKKKKGFLHVPAIKFIG